MLPTAVRMQSKNTIAMSCTMHSTRRSAPPYKRPPTQLFPAQSHRARLYAILRLLPIVRNARDASHIQLQFSLFSVSIIYTLPRVLYDTGRQTLLEYPSATGFAALSGMCTLVNHPKQHDRQPFSRFCTVYNSITVPIHFLRPQHIFACIPEYTCLWKSAVQ